MTKQISCEFCHKNFKFEKNLEKHSCEKMKRHKFMRTKKGKSVFTLYQDWMKLKHRIPPSKESFINSRYYKSFVKFQTFSKRMALPNTYDYMKFMVTKTFEPNMWANLDMYQHFINKFDSLYTPIEIASMSVDTLIQLSRIFDCELNEVFDEMDADDIIKLTQAKKLSPWILLFSNKFFSFLTKNTSSEQKMLIQTMINPSKWKAKFKSNPKQVKKMKKIVRELGI